MEPYVCMFTGTTCVCCNSGFSFVYIYYKLWVSLCTVGLVVESHVAIVRARVRFPDGAVPFLLFFIFQTALLYGTTSTSVAAQLDSEAFAALRLSDQCIITK